MDYLEILSNNRDAGPEYAATAKRTRVVRNRSRSKRKQRSLTQPTKEASLVKSTISPGKRKARSTKKSSTESKTMARKKRKAGRRKGGRLTKNEIKRAGGIPQAWRARKSDKRATVKSPRKRRYMAAAKPANRKTAKRRSGRRYGGAVTMHLPARRRSTKSGRAKARSATVTIRSGKRKRSRKLALPRKAKRLYMIAAEKPRHRRRARRAAPNPVRRHRRRHSHRRGAMENPMGGVELFVGMVTGLAGFLTADAIDRVLATHALVDSGTKDPASGLEKYVDTPPTTGDYAGLYNATAICAPMDAKRWIVGLLVAGVPITIAHFIGAPTGRAALQFFGFAAGVRIVGKALTDAVAMLAQSNPTGQRLYDGEMRAAGLKSGSGTLPANLSYLPTAGLGSANHPRALAAPCPPGCGCGRYGVAGTGYPSQPREVARPVAQTSPPPPPPPPAPPPGPPPAVNQAPSQSTLRGVSGPPRRFDRFNWGNG